MKRQRIGIGVPYTKPESVLPLQILESSVSSYQNSHPSFMTREHYGPVGNQDRLEKVSMNDL